MRTLRFQFLLLLLFILNVNAAVAPLRLHQTAIKRSKALAGHLRLAFRSILIDTPPPSSAPRRQLYCSLRRPDEPIGSGHLPIGNSSAIPGPASTGPRPSAVPPSNSSSTRGSNSPGATQSSTPPPAPPPQNNNNSPWKLRDTFAGNSFFDGWDFFTAPDPTHGTVNYVDEGTGRANNLVRVNDQGRVIMAVETTPQVANNRMSIRITTKESFHIGSLIVLDAVHVPTGCAVWPAWWTNGPNWPAGGEIDILEPINDYTNNQAALHTSIGCTLTSTSNTQLGILGTVLDGTDCAAETTGNRGCGVRFDSNVSAGPGFNRNDGGVYAMRWDNSGVAVWFFPRDQIPNDLNSGKPRPESWGKPQAAWADQGCTADKFFNNQNAIFDTTLCGDWAGSAWGGSGVPGQEQSCAQRTGFATCEEFVRARGSAFSEAYWEINYMKLFTTY